MVDGYLQREMDIGLLFVLEHREDHPYEQMHTSPFGVIPKKHKPDKWRLIVDLSSPEGSSINDAISKELCSVAYSSIDRSLGPRCLSQDRSTSGVQGSSGPSV